MFCHSYVTKLECSVIGSFWGLNLRDNSSHNITVIMISDIDKLHSLSTSLEPRLKWERLFAIRRIPLGEMCTLMTIFYADDGLIASRNPKTTQTAVDLLTGLFDRVGLQTNTTKTEIMVFVPGKIRTFLLETA